MNACICSCNLPWGVLKTSYKYLEAVPAYT